MHTRCHLLARSRTLDAPPCGRARRSRTDHRCFVETLAERVARVTASAAARRQLRRALGALLGDRDFDRDFPGAFFAPSAPMGWGGYGRRRPDLCCFPMLRVGGRLARGGERLMASSSAKG